MPEAVSHSSELVQVYQWIAITLAGAITAIIGIGTRMFVAQQAHCDAALAIERARSDKLLCSLESIQGVISRISALEAERQIRLGG